MILDSFIRIGLELLEGLVLVVFLLDIELLLQFEQYYVFLGIDWNFK